jgi:hypothetical protein
MKNLILIPTIIFLFSISTHANEMLIGHDQIVYNPTSLAVKNVTFKVTVKGLAKEVSALKSYGDIDSISYHVTVGKFNKYDIKVVGVSPKFNDLHKNLKSKLIPYLELLFPTSLNNFYRGYSIKASDKKIVAIDKSFLKPIRESYLFFQNNGALKENKIKTPQGTQIINFSYANGRSGFKKLLLENVNRKIIYGPSHLLSNTKIKYSKGDGRPYPEKIETEFIFENKENNMNGNRVNKLGEDYLITDFKFN